MDSSLVEKVYVIEPGNEPGKAASVRKPIKGETVLVYSDNGLVEVVLS